MKLCRKTEPAQRRVRGRTLRSSGGPGGDTSGTPNMVQVFLGLNVVDLARVTGIRSWTRRKHGGWQMMSFCAATTNDGCLRRHLGGHLPAFHGSSLRLLTMFRFSFFVFFVCPLLLLLLHQSSSSIFPKITAQKPISAILKQINPQTRSASKKYLQKLMYSKTANLQR